MATEKRLIDANEFKMAIEKMLADACAAHDWGYESILEDCIWELDAQTTVDAVEVVHGRWDKYTDEKFNGYDSEGRIRYRKVRTYYCDKCGHGSAVKSNYCPQCGAKMDGDGNG